MPEEINRVLTDQISDYCFTPSGDADDNLRREGIGASKVFRVGNVMIDTLLENLKQSRATRAFEQFNVKPKQFAVLTLHRPSNVDA